MSGTARFIALASALALAFGTGAFAQSADSTATNSHPEFVDADGDGISDYAAAAHMMHYRGPGGMFRDLLGSLTADQQAELEQLVADLKAQDATPDAIRDAVVAKLQEFGVTLPEPGQVPPGLLASLTADQQAEIQQLIADLKAQDATPQEIRDAVRQKLEEYGVTMPQREGPPPGLLASLTADQQTEIQQLVADLKAQDATPAAIRDAVVQKLQEYGVTVPAGLGRSPRQFVRPEPMTADQRMELRALVKSMRAEGKTPADIRAAVAAQLQEWGRMMPGRRGGQLPQGQQNSSQTSTDRK